MFNNETVHSCLDNVASIEDAQKWCPSYLTYAILDAAASEDIDMGTALARVAKGAVDKVLYSVVNRKKINETVKSVLSDFQLFDGRADFESKNSNTGRFVGLMFTLRANQDLQVLIDKVAVQFDMPCPNMKLYLFSDDQPEALSVTPINYTGNRGVQWNSVKLNLSNNTTTYYLGYFETDLGAAQSIKKKLDYVNGYAGCSTCGQNSNTNAYYQARSKYMTIQPFYVDSSYLDGIDMPIMNNMVMVDQNNFGLNLHMSAGCDISDFLCRNAALLTEPLNLQFAIDALGLIMMSTRTTAILEKAKQDIAYVLSGDKTQYNKGLNGELEKMIDALNIDLSSINEVCLPCAKKQGMRYRGL